MPRITDEKTVEIEAAIETTRNSYRAVEVAIENVGVLVIRRYQGRIIGTIKNRVGDPVRAPRLLEKSSSELANRESKRIPEEEASS